MRRILEGSKEITPKLPMVFLGGTVDSAKGNKPWREILEGLVDQTKCRLYNPIVEEWSLERRVEEEAAKDASTHMLFVITTMQHGTYSLVELAVTPFARPHKTTLVAFLDIDGAFDDAQKLSNEGSIKLLRQYKNVLVFNSLEAIADYCNTQATV